MKIDQLSSKMRSWGIAGVILMVLLVTAFASLPARAASPVTMNTKWSETNDPDRILTAPQGTIVSGTLAVNTIWTKANSPYQIDVSLEVPQGVTLTIEPGVVIETANIQSVNYNFEVYGKLLAVGTAAEPITFTDTPLGWSGIILRGTPEAINRGSILEYVILNGGGNGAAGSGANLSLQFSEVIVRHCQFNDSPGDGILGDDGDAEGVAHVYDSSFTNNAGYAIDFQDGSVNPVLSNLTATGNGWDDGSGHPLPYGGNLVNLETDTLQGAHTWENMGLPYLIVQMTVGADSVLTIEPGVRVLARPGNDALNIAGRLIANATAAQLIELEPADPAMGWAGLHIIGSETQLSTGNVLNHVIINKGGAQDWCNFSVEYGEALVTNSLIQNSPDDNGVCLDHQATLSMSDTQLIGNQGYAMDVTDPDAQFTLARITATANLTNSIGIGDRNYIHGQHAWTKSGLNVYDLHSVVTIAPDGVLNVEPGVTVRGEYGRGLTVNGVLTASGTLADPILFAGTEHTPGHWGGLAFTGSTTQRARGTFKYTTIEDGGYGGYGMVQLQNTDVTFDHCTLRNSSHAAIHILPDIEAVMRSSRVLSATPTQVSWSKFMAIGGEAINNDAAQPVLAAYNWWDSATGPTADDNPTGTGESIEGAVVYRPFLLGPSGSFVFLPYLKR